MANFDFDDSVPVPLRWRVGLRLSRVPAGALPADALRWPRYGAPLVVFDRIDMRAGPVLPEGGAEVIAAEVGSGEELVELATLTARENVSALFFTPAQLHPEALARACAVAPAVEIVSLAEAGGQVFAVAARRMEALLRQRFLTTLLAHWRKVLVRHENALTQLFPRARSLDEGQEHLVSAPLVVLEEEHVAGVDGCWWAAAVKPANVLGISYARLSRLRARRWQRLKELTDGAAIAPLTIAVVDDEFLENGPVKAIASHLQRARRDGRVMRVDSAADLEAMLRDGGHPDLVWLDIPPSTGAQDERGTSAQDERGRRAEGELSREALALVRRVRRAELHPIVIGKLDGHDLEDVQRLRDLGALPLWETGAGLDGENRGGLAFDTEAHFARALEMAEEKRRILHALEIVRRIERESAGAWPEEVGAPEVSLARLRERAARWALAAAEGNHARAAQMLGIDRKSLARSLRAGLSP